MENLSCAKIKQNFFEDNAKLVEIHPAESNKFNDGFVDINEDEDELWLLQCPKGIDIQELENHKLKLPGRTKIKHLEAVAMELPAMKKTFGYCNSKNKYKLKELQILGRITLREKYDGTESLIPEQFKESCPAMGPVPLPESIKMRHPLLGANFDKFLKIDKNIVKRLQMADKGSSLKQVSSKNSTKKRKNNSKTITDVSSKKVKTIKKEKQDFDIEDISDLQWLKKI